MKKTNPIRDCNDVNRFLKYLRDWNESYYLAAMIGIHWGLRYSDISSLTFKDVVAGRGARIQIKDRVRLTEKKTGHTRDIFITEKIKNNLHSHIKKRVKSDGAYNPDALLILSGQSKGGDLRPLSRYQAWRAFSTAAKAVGLEGPIGTHGMRKTFAYQAWEKNGVRVDLIQKIFGHSSLDTTLRYACIPSEEEEKVYKGLDFGVDPATRRRRPEGENRGEKYAENI
jgi:integrase